MKTFSITKKLTSAFVALILTAGTGITLTACGDQTPGTTEPEVGTPIIYQIGESPSMYSFVKSDSTDTANKHFQIVLANAVFGAGFGVSDIAVTTNYGDFQVSDVKVADTTETINGEVIAPNTEAVVTVNFPGELPEQYSYTLKLNSQVVDTAGNPVNYLQYNTSDLGSNEELTRSRVPCTAALAYLSYACKIQMYRSGGTSSEATSPTKGDPYEGYDLITSAIDKITANVTDSPIDVKPVFVAQFINDLGGLVYYSAPETSSSETGTTASDAGTASFNKLDQSFSTFAQTLKDSGYIVSEGIVRPETAQVIASEVYDDFALPTDVERASVEETASAECIRDTGAPNRNCSDLVNLRTILKDPSIIEITKVLNTVANDYNATVYALIGSDGVESRARPSGGKYCAFFWECF
jgi:hypothetical protein